MDYLLYQLRIPDIPDRVYLELPICLGLNKSLWVSYWSLLADGVSACVCQRGGSILASSPPWIGYRYLPGFLGWGGSFFPLSAR